MQRFAGTASSITRERAWVAGAFVASLLAWMFWAGKDLSWDVLNHHAYLPFSLLSGRFATDLFAAGPQSYQNPIGYLPFHFLLASSMPGWAVGVGLTLVHASVVWPLWRLACLLWPAREPEARWWRASAVALAALAPTFLLLAGTSSVDPIAAVLVLAALSLALTPGEGLSRPLAAGLAVGAACAIKLTNAVFAVAIAATLLAGGPHGWRERIRLLLAYCAAVLSAVLVLFGPWALWLWRSFDSPLYPLFNAWFRSPYAPLETVASGRFVPTGWTDWLSRPLAMAQVRSMVHTEALAPDLRPMALLVFAAWAMARRLWRRTHAPTVRDDAASASDAGRGLGIFVVASYGLWMATSGNSRYGLPLLMALGPALVLVIQRTVPSRLARIAVGSCVALQLLHHGVSGEQRYGTAVSWSQPRYIPIEVPERLRTEPALHLSLGTPSYSALVPMLDHRGAFVNAIGSWSLPTEGPLGQRLQHLLQQWQGRTRALHVGFAPVGDGAEVRRMRLRADRAVYRFGLQFDWSDCLAIRLPILPAHGDKPAARTPGIPLLSCALRPRTTDDPGYEAERVRAEQVFAVLERACQTLLGPTPMATNGDLGAWRRHYLNSDVRVVVSFTEGVSMSHFRSWKHVPLGTAEEVLAGRGRSACDAWKDLDVQ